MKKFRQNDVIKNGSVTRKIVKVLNKGYLWCYPDVPTEVFNSNNSNDVELVLGWKKID